MLTSMTGFGRAVVDAPFGKLITEIQSVNRKYLEVVVALPKEFGRLEHEIRTWIGEKISRGQVSVRIHLLPKINAALEQLPNLETLRTLKQEWEKISQSLDCDPKHVDLPFLMLYYPVQQQTHFAEDKDLIVVEKCLKLALEDLVAMKIKEGKTLVADVKQRLSLIKENLKTVELFAPDVVERMRSNLLEKLKDLRAAEELDQRLLQETLLFADRVDISEEITRLKSHFDQFQEMLKSKEKTIGRKMDFLIQEIGRELNTMGSKSPDAKIAHLIVEMKSTLEKIREQIQNLE